MAVAASQPWSRCNRLNQKGSTKDVQLVSQWMNEGAEYVVGRGMNVRCRKEVVGLLKEKGKQSKSVLAQKQLIASILKTPRYPRGFSAVDCSRMRSRSNEVRICHSSL